MVEGEAKWCRFDVRLPGPLAVWVLEQSRTRGESAAGVLRRLVVEETLRERESGGGER